MRWSVIRNSIGILLLLALALSTALGASASQIERAAHPVSLSVATSSGANAEVMRPVSPDELSGTNAGTTPNNVGSVSGTDQPAGSESGKLLAARGIFAGGLDGTTKWLMAMMSASFLLVAVAFAVQRAARRSETD